jgi:hypothetical protein
MIVLPAGLKLIIPIIDIDPAETLPPWKRWHNESHIWR